MLLLRVNYKALILLKSKTIFKLLNSRLITNMQFDNSNFKLNYVTKITVIGNKLFHKALFRKANFNE